ncbi:MAG: TIM-barrel domain-containing protein [Polyangiales bacterium]
MRLTLTGFLLALGCSSSSAEPPKPPPVEASVGGFRVRLEVDPVRLVVARPDGRVLFDGLPPADVAPQTDDADPPPLVGIAVRDVETKVEALYGSYQFTDTGSAWRVAKRAANVKSGDTMTFDAVDDQGTLASVSIAGDGRGQLTIAVTPTAKAQGSARTWASMAASCEEGDRFQGFGAQQRDVEFRGQTVPIFVSEPGVGKRDDDANIAIWYLAGTRHASSFSAPIYLSRRGYVAALDTPGRATFAMCSEEDRLRIAGDVDAASHTFTLRVFDGPTPKEAMQRSASFFGKPRLPPRLAFAPWNDAIFGTASVEAFAKLLRDADIPSSAIWTEDFRGGAFFGTSDDYKLAEEWDVDRTLYPDFEGMISRLHDGGFAFFTYFNTFVEKDSNIWKEAQPKNVLVKKQDGSDYVFTSVKQKPTGMLDLTHPAAKQFMADKLKAILAMGSDGWMGDYGEWFPLDAKTTDGSDPWAAHGLYPKAWQEAQRAALDSDVNPSTKSRRLAFVRSGGLRSGPLVDVVWGGDQATDMSDDDGLPTVIPMGLGLGVAGISTYGHDIAGYQSALRKPTDKETFFRWVEVGAFTPVMRTHHGTQPKKEWMLQSDAESTAHFRKYAILHQQLLPVWESLAKEASDTGVPIWRSLAVEAPEDDDAWKIADQFMVGPNILVAPVVKKGATSRSVHLPPGKWLAWNGGATVEGTITANAALGDLPVYVREGTVLSLLPDKVRSVIEEAKGVVRASDVGDDRVVIVFGHGAGRFVEAGGLEYAVDPASGAGTWNGVALAACASSEGPPPCVEKNPDKELVRVVGPGTYAGKSTVTIKGGMSTRSLAIELR